MGTINYISCIVRIIESPKLEPSGKSYSKAEFWIQLPQRRKKKILKLVSFGKLAEDICKCYKKNEYLIVQGHVTIYSPGSNASPKKNSKPVRRVKLTAQKVYPFLLRK